MLFICLIYFAYMKQKWWLKYLNGKWLSEMSNAHVQKTLERIRRKLKASSRAAYESFAAIHTYELSCG